MDNIAVHKRSHHMQDGICLADIGEELVAQAFAGACACDKPGDVNEGDSCGDDFLRMVHFLEASEPSIRHGDDTSVGLDGGERIISG